MSGPGDPSALNNTNECSVRVTARPASTLTATSQWSSRNPLTCKSSAVTLDMLNVFAVQPGAVSQCQIPKFMWLIQRQFPEVDIMSYISLLRSFN